MENGKIRPRADPKPLNRLTQNLKQVIMSARWTLCKISCNSVHWGLLGKCVKYNENFSSIYMYFFCWPTYWSDCSVDFHVRWLRQRGLMQGSNLFRNQNSELISNPWKIPQSRKLGPKNGLGHFRPKTLLYKNFTYKRPLIVIVGP